MATSGFQRTTAVTRFVGIVLAVLGGACEVSEVARPAANPVPDAPARRAVAARPVPERPRIVVLGDSLTAGLGLDRREAFPSVLERKVQAAGYEHEVVNAGVSADTTAGGLRRLDWALEGDVRILVVALGGNDGLRGLPVSEMRRNLDTIIERAKARGIAVLLTGMEAPPNFGARYTAEFREAFQDLAAEHDVQFVPFLLQGVAGVPELNQRDGIHPNPEGARLVAELLWPSLHTMLDQSPSQ